MATATDRSRFLQHKRLILATCGCLFAVIGIHSLVVAGWLFPLRIVSGSMGANWPGEHFRVQCEDCGYSYLCDAGEMPENAHTICPNCGWHDNRVTAAARRPGKRVLLDKWTYRRVDPRRWDLVVAEQNNQSGRLIVKRVVGEPGERLAIRDGDIYVDKKIVTKQPDQFLALAQTVHDDRYRPARSPALRRWAPASANSDWQSTHRGFRWQPGGDENRQTDWLIYTHREPFLPSVTAERPHVVMDSHAFNQATSRQLHVVTDLALTMGITWRGDGTLRLRRSGEHSDDVSIEFHPTGANVSCGNHTVSGAMANGTSGQTILFGNWDRRLFLVLDGKTVIDTDFHISPSDDSPTPFAVSVSGFERLEVTGLVVLRDLHYFVPDGANLIFPNLRSDRYVLMGDNQPRSLDARQNVGFAVPREAIFGRVLQ